MADSTMPVFDDAGRRLSAPAGAESAHPLEFGAAALMDELGDRVCRLVAGLGEARTAA